MNKKKEKPAKKRKATPEKYNKDTVDTTDKYNFGGIPNIDPKKLLGCG